MARNCGAIITRLDDLSTVFAFFVALRANKTLVYDADQMKVLNDEKANNYLDRNYRKGWEIEDM